MARQWVEQRGVVLAVAREACDRDTFLRLFQRGAHRSGRRILLYLMPSPPFLLLEAILTLYSIHRRIDDD